MPDGHPTQSANQRPRHIDVPTGRYRFPKRYRLKQAAQFERVLRKARIRRNRGPLRILAVANTMPSARLGLIVGKRALRQANRRNAAKRVVREVFRNARPDLPPVDVVVQLRGPLDRAQLRAWLEEELGAMTQSANTSRGKHLPWVAV